MISSLLDPYGRPVRLNAEPLPQPDQWQGYHIAPGRPTQGLSPEMITGILAEADAGQPQRQAELFCDAASKDDHLPGVLRTRTMAPAKVPWELHPASTDATDKKVVEWLRPKLQALGLRGALRRLQGAVAWGYAAEQIVWRPSAGDVDVAELRSWPVRYLLPDAGGGIHRICQATDPTGMEMPFARFIVHQPAELGEDTVASGLMRPAIWFWFFKNYCLKAWVQYAEIYGQPFRWATYPAGAKSTDKDNAFMALVKMGSEAVALLPEGFKVQILEMSNKGGPDLYDRLIARVDQGLSILFLGQTLTTAVGATGGAYAAARVHDQVRQDLVEWDALQLADTLRRDLLTPWCQFRWGPEVEVPQLQFRTEPPEDQEASARTFKMLITEMGLPVATAHLYQRFGVPPPQKGEETLAGAPPSAPSAEGEVRARRTEEALVAGARDSKKAGKPGGSLPSPADETTW